MSIQQEAGLNAVESERMARMLAEVIADCEDAIANPPCRICGYWDGTHSKSWPEGCPGEEPLDTQRTRG